MTRVPVLLRLAGEMSGVVGGVDGGDVSTVRALLLTILLLLLLPLLEALTLLLRLLPGSLGLSEGKSWIGIRRGSFPPTVGLGKPPTPTVVLDGPGVVEPIPTVVLEGPGVAEPTPIALGLVGVLSGLVGVLNGPVSTGSGGVGEPYWRAMASTSKSPKSTEST